jgi:ABC-type nitrate/sulfonate/bicarbonate transport system substrate-binding protein
MTSKRWKYPVVPLVAVGLIATACGGGTSDAAASDTGPTTVRWIYDYFPTAADLPILAAQQQGWFADAGIEVETTPGGEVNQLQDVGIGQHDITVGPGVDLVQSVTQDLPIVSIGVVQPGNVSGLLCNPNVGLDPDDPTTMRGHAIGVTANNVVDTAVWNTYKERYGLEGQITEITIGDDITPLYTGQVDCFPAFLTQLPAVAAEYYGTEAVTYEVNADVEAIGQVLMANTTFAEENPEAVSGFVEAYARGMQWAIQNPEEAADLLLETYPDYGRSTAESEIPALTAFWHSELQDSNGLLYMDDSSWQPSVDLLITAGELDGPPALSDVYTTEYLPATAVMP